MTRDAAPGDPAVPPARDLVDELPVAVIVTDAAGQILTVNDAATTLLGREREDVLAKHLGTFVRPDAPASATPPGATVAARVHRPDGSERAVETRACGLPDGRLVSVLHDVTASAARLEALRDTEQQLLFVANTVPALLAYVGNDERYVWVNESYRRWFGQPPETTPGRHISEVLGAKAWATIRHDVARALAGEEVTFDSHIVYHAGPREVQGCCLPHRDASGRVRGFVVLVHDVTAVRSAERARRHSERMLAESQTAAQVGSWEASYGDAGSRVPAALEWSDENYRMFGRDPREGKIDYPTFLAAIHPDDREAMGATARAGIERGGRFEKEYRIVRPDGTVRLIHAWTNVEKDAAGKPVRLLGTCQDITERKLAELEIRRAREQLQLVVDSTPAVIARYDVDLRLVWCNKSYAARFAQPPEALVGSSLRAVIGERAFALLEPFCQRVLRGETVELETDLEYTTLGLRRVQMVASPTLDPRGVPDGCVSVITDMTHRRELERALRVSEERYRSLVGAITSVVWTTNADRSFQEPQLAWEAYTGQSWRQHQGQGWVAAIHPDDRETIEQLSSRAPPVEGIERSACRVWHAPTGNYRHCERSAVAIRNPDGTIREWIGTLVDVHERERALQELKEADRRKDEFLAMLSHELRNPLAPILSAVEILRLVDQRDAEMSAKYRTVIAQQVQHMKRLLDDLLDVSRVSQGKIELRKERLDLGAILQRAVEVSRPLIDEMEQTLSVTAGAADVFVEADPTRVVQVFANLLNNAAKYSERGGHIELELSSDGREALVRVRDDGVGMSHDLLERAFDLFVQEERSLDRAQGGMGIGLTMVRSLVKMHGGSVRAFSEGPGRGCEVTVRLPRAPRPARQAAPRPPLAAARPRRVLVVDDNVDAARTLGDLLALLGHEVTLAHDGPRALVAAAAAAPDLVLIDIGLPGMDGYALAAALRGAGLGRAALVAVTGYGRDEDLQRSSEAGFDHHLVKPVDLAALQRITAE